MPGEGISHIAGKTGELVAELRDRANASFRPDGRPHLLNYTPRDAEMDRRAADALEAVARDRDEARAYHQDALQQLAAARDQRDAAMEALDGIYTYCNDTLSGRADGGPDDRQWQREAVIRARNLARPFARPEIEAAIQKRTALAARGEDGRG